MQAKVTLQDKTTGAVTVIPINVHDDEEAKRVLSALVFGQGNAEGKVYDVSGGGNREIGEDHCPF